MSPRRSFGSRRSRCRTGARRSRSRAWPTGCRRTRPIRSSRTEAPTVPARSISGALRSCQPAEGGSRRRCRLRRCGVRRGSSRRWPSSDPTPCRTNFGFGNEARRSAGKPFRLELTMPGTLPLARAPRWSTRRRPARSRRACAKTSRPKWTFGAPERYRTHKPTLRLSARRWPRCPTHNPIRATSTRCSRPCATSRWTSAQHTSNGTCRIPARRSAFAGSLESYDAE